MIYWSWCLWLILLQTRFLVHHTYYLNNLLISKMNVLFNTSVELVFPTHHARMQVVPHQNLMQSLSGYHWFSSWRRECKVQFSRAFVDCRPCCITCTYTCLYTQWVCISIYMYAAEESQNVLITFAVVLLIVEPCSFDAARKYLLLLYPSFRCNFSGAPSV